MSGNGGLCVCRLHYITTTQRWQHESLHNNMSQVCRQKWYRLFVHLWGFDQPQIHWWPWNAKSRILPERRRENLVVHPGKSAVRLGSIGASIPNISLQPQALPGNESDSPWWVRTARARGVQWKDSMLEKLGIWATAWEQSLCFYSNNTKSGKT